MSFIATWLKTVMHNFQRAFFSQLFFIQSLVRTVYGWLATLWTEPKMGRETREETEGVSKTLR